MELIAPVFTFFIAHPWVAFVVSGAVAGLAALGGGSRFIAAVALLWAFYGCWEYLVQYKTPEANIRVDLLVIAPALAVLTIAAVVVTIRKLT